KKESIEALHQLIEAQLLGQRGDKERQPARGVQHCPGVLLPHRVKGMEADHPPVCGKANEGASGCHGAAITPQRSDSVPSAKYVDGGYPVRSDCPPPRPLAILARFRIRRFIT